MAHSEISLTKNTRTIKSGKVQYWVLRYYDDTGRHRGESIGRVDKISKRQANKIRQQKLQEFRDRPGRRNRVDYSLERFVEHYFEVREHELRPKTIELHRQAANYMLEYFGR